MTEKVNRIQVQWWREGTITNKGQTLKTFFQCILTLNNMGKDFWSAIIRKHLMIIWFWLLRTKQILYSLGFQTRGDACKPTILSMGQNHGLLTLLWIKNAPRDDKNFHHFTQELSETRKSGCFRAIPTAPTSSFIFYSRRTDHLPPCTEFWWA